MILPTGKTGWAIFLGRRICLTEDLKMDVAVGKVRQAVGVGVKTPADAQKVVRAVVKEEGEGLAKDALNSFPFVKVKVKEQAESE